MAKSKALQATHDISNKSSKLLEKIKQNGLQAICFFNNKGGVGKTTLIANLGAELSINLKQRVLVVDADPQCNLTQYVLSDEDFTETYKSESEAQTIYSVIHPLSIGKGYSQNLPIIKTKNFGFDVIVGDPRLALKEDLLAQDWRDAKAGGTRGLRTTFVFSDLIEKAKNEYDFVLFDMGPSLGAINRSILLAANYFLVPMSIDIFSLWAVKNISDALSIWQSELENGLRLAEDPTEILGMSKNKSRLKFLGYVTQQHKEKSENGNPRIVEAYASIKEKLPREIKNKLGNLYPEKGFTPHLGDIKHLASLAPKSQSLHTPMITVTLKGSYTVSRKQARELYEGIGERFLENLAISLKK
ncbi:AAA family ATPase [Methylobacillus flagellatus]|uniref:ParA family protein n=1 Tax=Methylobacillus flagellatus TaxID=405 RepID=UPI002853FE15|nr:AAA family ATPase [Methylobacillus flagellatus]MDR5170585.1 AAA family ATPase [Methylobacillus flagellatus]